MNNSKFATINAHHNYNMCHIQCPVPCGFACGTLLSMLAASKHSISVIGQWINELIVITGSVSEERIFGSCEIGFRGSIHNLFQHINTTNL